MDLGWSALLHEVSQLMQSSARQFSTANEEYVEYVLERLSICLRSVNAIKTQVEEEVGEDSSHALFRIYRLLSDIVSRLKTLRRQWSEQLDNLAFRLNFRYQAPTTSGVAALGRPSLEITHAQLDYLHSLSFSWTEIAHLLGVSRMTIYRRRVEYGMIEEPSRTLTDSDLEEILREIRVELPELGETMAAGRLRSLGYRVPRQQLREGLRRIDPLSAALRWSTKISRRPYTVSGPNCLWHIGKSCQQTERCVLCGGVYHPLATTQCQ